MSLTATSFANLLESVIYPAKGRAYALAFLRNIFCVYLSGGELTRNSLLSSSLLVAMQAFAGKCLVDYAN